MARLMLPLALLLGLVPVRAGAQPSEPAPGEEKGTYLGILFSAVPEARYAQLPALPRDQGVLITHVLPDSPGVAAGLQRDDILVEYDSQKVRGGEHLARLIRADRAGRKVRLAYFRNGQEMTAEATLTLGPVLRLARETEVALGGAKTTAPPAVSVAATPLSDGTLKLAIEYYHEGTGRFRQVTCSGSPEEINREVRQLPARVQNLTRVALNRMRALELHRGTRTNSSIAPKQP